MIFLYLIRTYVCESIEHYLNYICSFYWMIQNQRNDLSIKFTQQKSEERYSAWMNRWNNQIETWMRKFKLPSFHIVVDWMQPKHNVYRKVLLYLFGKLHRTVSSQKLDIRFVLRRSYKEKICGKFMVHRTFPLIFFH